MSRAQNKSVPTFIAYMPTLNSLLTLSDTKASILTAHDLVTLALKDDLGNTRLQLALAHLNIALIPLKDINLEEISSYLRESETD